MVALYYKWTIEKIELYPFGGHLVFNNSLNKPLGEEFMIVISGIVTQNIFYGLIWFLYNINLLTTYNFNLFTNYHLAIMMFNLMPVFPLDGAKLLNLLLNKFMPFKVSHKATIYISYLWLFFLIILIIKYYYNINFYLIIILILTKVISEHKSHDYIFNAFLLERFLKPDGNKKTLVLKNKTINNMFRNYKHLFIINSQSFSERYLLKIRFRG